MPEIITSRSNPLVKMARSLRQRKARAESGLFLVEGILHTGEAAAAGWDLDSILYAPELISGDFARSLIAEQEARGVRCQPVSEDVFDSVAEKENPQGIVALVHQRHWQLDHLSRANFRRGVALIAPQDPGNVGTILRTIDAVGADGLILLEGGVDPFHPSAVRASMGTLFWKPVVQTSFAAFVDWGGAAGIRLVGTSARGTLDYREVALGDHPAVLVMGSEQRGLSREQVSACDLLVRLPMHGRASSLNLAVACGVLLYALMET
jgi:TrmH family RNA methyltransferase